MCLCLCAYSRLTLQVMSAVHSVYQALLSLKNIPTLEAAYKLVLGEMTCALSSLTVTLSSRAPAAGVTGPSIQHPAFTNLSIPLDKAQFTLVFNLSTLTTIGNTKNSLIGVSATVFFAGYFSEKCIIYTSGVFACCLVIRMFSAFLKSLKNYQQHPVTAF